MQGTIIQDVKFTDNIKDFATHSHNCYEIIYIKEGQLDVHINNIHYKAKSPCLIFVSKFEQHSLMVTGNAYKRYYLCISPIVASTMIRDYTLLTILSNRHDDFCHVLDVSNIEQDIDRLFSLFLYEFNSNKPYSLQQQTALLSELLIILYRNAPSLFTIENNKSISVIWQIQCRLEKNCSEHFTLQSLSDEYHVSACYLSHLFKKITGYPLMQYLTMCRLSLARQLLSETDMSITEIVYNTGFSDSSNFSRLFKREMNITPMEYRRKSRK